jgi:RNA polymerase sigma-70 factor (ECF subfamily)
MTTIALQAARTGGRPQQRAGERVARRAAATADDYDQTFTSAYQTYYTKIFAFIYSRVRDVELARDLVSEVFEKAYMKGHEVRDKGAYGAWIFMIAKNLIAGHYRSAKRRMGHLESAKDELRFAEAPPSPEQFAIRDERVGRLIHHLRTLPRRDQELLSLKFDGELTHTEIGQVMGLTPLNARVAIFRALRRLRARLEKDEVVR